jgi:hypothetical protein
LHENHSNGIQLTLEPINFVASLVQHRQRFGNVAFKMNDVPIKICDSVTQGTVVGGNCFQMSGGDAIVRIQSKILRSEPRNIGRKDEKCRLSG